MAPDPKPSAAIAWKIRPFRATDAPAIAEILRDSAEAAQWPPGSYAKVSESPGGLVLVCDASGQPVGFVAARQAADEAEILNIAVHGDLRGKGIASALLLAALDEFRRSAIARVFLELRESNLPALALYNRHGFTPSGRRKAYYHHPTEDAISMLRKLTGSSG
ncbi:MAG TPA: ribosomal protein S18-alanine N-acetyltransferase [Candidatus Acidoferrum sp.]|jgi:ribosomal-protein-alanine N-acetyltransferase|nr:ribosomal protein S18-alanine N-acetyltransferase [Candidatus Acidoferrum sp.]